MTLAPRLRAIMHSCRSSSSSSSSSIKRPGSSLVVLLLACGQLWHAQPAAAQANRTSVVSGLPKVIPLPLLLGNTKYRNPQVRVRRVWVCLAGNSSRRGCRWR